MIFFYCFLLNQAWFLSDALGGPHRFIFSGINQKEKTPLEVSMAQRKNTYDIVRHSLSLREAIKIQLEKKGIKVYAVCIEMGFKPSKMYDYLKGDSSRVPQYKLLLFCQKIGIDVSLKITLND